MQETSSPSQNIVYSCKWPPLSQSQIRDTIHHLDIAVFFQHKNISSEARLSLDQSLSPVIHQTRMALDIDLSSSPFPVRTPSQSAVRSAYQLRIRQPRRALLLPILTFLFLLYLSSCSTHTQFTVTSSSPSSRSVLQQRIVHLINNHHVLRNLTLFSASLVIGPFFCGYYDHSLVIAFAWKTFVYSNKQWRATFWMDIRMWSYYVCLLCLLPLILYSFLHCQIPSFKSVYNLGLFYFIEGLCIFIPFLTAIIVMGLMICNYPFSVSIFSLNMTWTPLLTVIHVFRSCKRNRIVFRKSL